MSRALALLLGLFLASAVLCAQVENAIINGQIRDTSGAVIPRVDIKITRSGTNLVRTTRSNEEGPHSVPNLVPGNYNVVATPAGFKTIDGGGISLRIGDRVLLDLIMQVSTQSETVTLPKIQPFTTLGGLARNSAGHTGCAHRVGLYGAFAPGRSVSMEFARESTIQTVLDPVHQGPSCLWPRVRGYRHPRRWKHRYRRTLLAGSALSHPSDTRKRSMRSTVSAY